MLTILDLRLFFGWCTVVNLGMYLFTALVVLMFRDLVQSLHSKFTKVPESQLPALYFDYLAKYKLMILFYNLVPWIVLHFFLQQN